MFAAMLALVVAGCDRNAPVSLADAHPRFRNGKRTFRDFAQEIIDSIPGRRVSVVAWTVSERNMMVQAAEGARRFVENSEVVGVVGHSGSRDALIGAKVYNEAGLPQIVPNATSRRLAAAGPWTYPIVPDDSVEGAFLASYAIDSLHAERIQLFYLGDEYGTGIRDGVLGELRRRKRDLADATMVTSMACAAVYANDLNRYPVTAALRRTRPDVIVLATGTKNADCLAQIMAPEAPGAWILGADGFVPDAGMVRAMSPALRARIRSVSFWQADSTDASRRFAEQWRREFGNPPSALDALSLDGFLLLAAAVRETRGTRAAVREYLESLGHSRPPFVGLTGPISFDHHRRVGLTLRVTPLPTPP